MRFGYLLIVAITGILVYGEAAVAVSDSNMVMLATHGKTTGREQTGNRDNMRALRTRSETEEGSSDDPASGKYDEEDRDLIISTINRPKYWRWFRAGMTPYDVQQVLGLTGVRRLWKPIKRRVYDGYMVFYSEKCHKVEYRAFCKAHADKV